MGGLGAISPAADIAIRIGVALVAAAIALYIAWVKRDLWRPGLRFQLGVGVAIKGSEIKWHSDVETIVLFGKLPPECDVYALLPFWMCASRSAVKSVSILLQYPVSNAIVKLEELSAVEEGTCLRVDEYNKNRSVSVMGRMASTALELPMLRIKESVGLADVLRFNTSANSRNETEAFWTERGMGRLYERLCKIEGFVNAVPVWVHVRSENHNEIARMLNVVCFNLTANDRQERLRKLSAVVSAYWHGYPPAPGVYFVPWPFKLFRPAFAEMHWLDLRPVKNAEGKKVFICLPPEMGYDHATVMMPVWKYREDSAKPILFEPMPSLSSYGRAAGIQLRELESRVRERFDEEAETIKARFRRREQRG